MQGYLVLKQMQEGNLKGSDLKAKYHEEKDFAIVPKKKWSKW
jgi:hypothetical protein